MGFLKPTKPSSDLLESGTRGTATIVKAEMTMTFDREGYMRKKSQEQLFSGEKSVARYKLELQVDLPGLNPYAATVAVSVPLTKIPFMAGGSVVPVLADPQNPDHVAIDWEGEFQKGTLAQMAAANPVLAAAMKGAGVDVDKASQEQAATLAAGQTPASAIFGSQPAAAATAPARDPLAQLKQLAELRDSGVLTASEFETQKAKILAE
jgi:hypothetical protein